MGRWRHEGLIAGDGSAHGQEAVSATVRATIRPSSTIVSQTV